jgi:hypothetical protein
MTAGASSGSAPNNGKCMIARKKCKQIKRKNIEKFSTYKILFGLGCIWLRLFSIQIAANRRNFTELQICKITEFTVNQYVNYVNLKICRIYR